ncbi:hypothetical protein R1sor_022391 [Riccia sorocarpa]|uniref:C2HC/C3H-type domain-containing protein n=1 Tax=Riccia sorocarpa TaxID=122646 RepID=A0ABD3GN17_9MARC
MVLTGQDMEPEDGYTRVQVVYYLTRGSQLQQPHLIDVPVSAHANGIYLRDVKKRLASIRGKAMGDSFSWSCKRNYKNNFIWQDLADDDRIVPLSDGELVLKGSELYTGVQEKSEFQEGQFDLENATLPSKIKKLASKKFDFEAVKRSLDLESDKLQEQSDLAAALSLSLQLMSDPHIKRFSKDKSAELNHQAKSRLSEAKSIAAEDQSLLDHGETDISGDARRFSKDNRSIDHTVTDLSGDARRFSKDTRSIDHTVTDLSSDARRFSKDTRSIDHSVTDLSGDARRFSKDTRSIDHPVTDLSGDARRFSKDNRSIDHSVTDLSGDARRFSKDTRSIDHTVTDLSSDARRFSKDNRSIDHTVTDLSSDVRRFSKDRSMDLNQQVMNSLSQAKSSAAEGDQNLLDQSVTDISSETLHSEESTVQKFSFNETVQERTRSTALASSSGTDRDSYSSLRRIEVMGRDRSHPRETPRSREVSRELPPQIPRDVVPREKSKEIARELHRNSVRDAPSETTSRESPGEVARESSSREQLPREVVPGEVSRESWREVTKELPPKDVLPRELPRASKDTGKSGQVKTDPLPTIKTKKSPTGSEAGDSTPFMLSPRRLMAVLSTTGQDKKSGKLTHSSSTRSSSSYANSTQDEGAMASINIKLVKQATRLPNFRLCSHVNHHATDSRPDSPEHPLSVPPRTASSSPVSARDSTTSRHSGGPYWLRWRSSRKHRNSSDGKEVEHPIPPRSSKPPPRKPDPALNQSFEFDTKVGNSKMSVADLLTGNNSSSSSESSNNAMTNSNKSASANLSLQFDGSERASVSASSSSENQNFVSVKKVITQQSASSTSSEGRPNLQIDTENDLPRISISESISEVRETTKGARPDSPESPMKLNRPSSPARTRLSSSPSFNRRIEDARARARSQVSKEIRAGESRSSKDLLKEHDRAKTSSASARSSSTRMPNSKNATTGAGPKHPSPDALNRSPPRINSIAWDSSPITPPKQEFVNRDERPLTAGRTNLDWERTLQENASLSLPPPDFGQILQECRQCGRTFKPDSLKVHMRGCHSLRRNKESQ